MDKPEDDMTSDLHDIAELGQKNPLSVLPSEKASTGDIRVSQKTTQFNDSSHVSNKRTWHWYMFRGL